MLERLLSNWPLKLLSLLLAFAIWLAVIGENRIVQDFAIPLDVVLPEELTLTAAPPTNLTVRLRGSETSIRTLDPLRLVVSLDLREVSPGKLDVQLFPENLTGVPAGVEVAFIDPSRVQLVVESRLRRELPVVPDLIGELPEGLALYQARTRPETLAVEGPESEVKALERLRTNPIRLDRLTRSVVQSATVVPERPNVRVLDPRPIELQLIIDTAPVDKTLNGVPVVSQRDDVQAVFTPTSLGVTLSGPAALLQRVGAEQVRVVAEIPANISSESQESQQVPVHVEFVELGAEDRERIRVKSVSQAQVAVRLGAQKVAS